MELNFTCVKLHKLLKFLVLKQTVILVYKSVSQLTKARLIVPSLQTKRGHLGMFGFQTFRNVGLVQVFIIDYPWKCAA